MLGRDGRKMEKQVEFDVTIGSKDMYDFLMRHFYSSFSGILGVVISVGALVLFFLGLGKRDLFQLALLLLLGLLFTVVQPVQMRLKAVGQIKANPMLKEPLHFLFNAKGMTVSQGRETASLPWEQVRRVKESKCSIFVYASSVNANIIPKAQVGEKLGDLKQIMENCLDKSVCQLK